MSYNHRATEEAVVKLEKQLLDIYNSAAVDLQNQIDEYFRRFYKEEKRLKKLVKKGEMTEKKFKEWKLAQINAQSGWEIRRQELAFKIMHVNELAADIVNGNLDAVYVLNATYSAYNAELLIPKDVYAGSDVHLLDIVQGKNHSEFRTLTVDPVRDYAWNYEKIQNTLAAGITAGDDLARMANRFMEVMMNNYNAALRNARTAMHSAANAGNSFTTTKIESLGYKVEDVWMATVDGRTRESHARLHGVAVRHGDKFPNGLRYPCDPEGYPSEVYNCRCTTVQHIIGINDDIMDNFPTTEEGMDALYSSNPKYAKKITKQGRNGIVKESREMTPEEKRQFVATFMNNDVPGYKKWLKQNADARLVKELKEKGLI